MKPSRYLGRLCPKGHDYEGTGQSLRNSRYACLECQREYLREHHRKNRQPRQLQPHRRFYEVWPTIFSMREEGATLTEIGSALFLSPGAVSAHINLAKKLGLYQPKAPKPDRVYLGQLCCRGHDYNGTGQSLRYVTDLHCVECRRQQSLEWKRRKDSRDSAA